MKSCKESLRGKIVITSDGTLAYEVIVVADNDETFIGIQTQGGAKSSCLRVFRHDQIQRIANNEGIERIASIVDRMNKFIASPGGNVSDILNVTAMKMLLEEMIEENLRIHPHDDPLGLVGANDLFAELYGDVEVHVEMDDETILNVPQKVDQLVIHAGDGCTINFSGQVCNADIQTGDGGSVDFAKVGVAGVAQGAGASMVVAERPKSFSYTQGPGSHAIIS